ncbi:tyrosine-type recombinase/integrase [Paenibacillus luteus]|nr:tyrosine-type recombinase/integrase [Paenibacillus luteus]
MQIEEKLLPHRFRHTYACQLLDNGAPLDFIQVC